MSFFTSYHPHLSLGWPHTDSDQPDDLTAILYLNKYWKKEWAGETAFFEAQEIAFSLLPRYGRIVVFNSSMEHAARSVGRLCPADRVIIVFKARPLVDTYQPKKPTDQGDGDGVPTAQAGDGDTPGPQLGEEVLIEEEDAYPENDLVL